MKENIWRYIATAALSGIFTLAAAQFMHVKDEVSQSELNAVVDSKTQYLADQMADMQKEVHQMVEQDSAWREQMLHTRIRVTWQ